MREGRVGRAILNFTYRDDWYSLTDDDGFSLTIVEPTNPDPGSWDIECSWRPSAYAGGSPGYDDSRIVPRPGAVVINELLAASPGAANAKPRVGPVVINEIMYNPDWPAGGSYTNDQYEYIELHNISPDPVTLYDYERGEAWKFTDGIEYGFPVESPVTIQGGGHILVVKNTTAFS